MSEISALMEKWYQNPTDKVQLLIIRDWYEENGDSQMIKVIDWFIQNNKCPQKIQNKYVWRTPMTQRQIYIELILEKPEFINQEIFNKLEKYKNKFNMTMLKKYNKRSHAYAALIKALVKIL